MLDSEIPHIIIMLGDFMLFTIHEHVNYLFYWNKIGTKCLYLRLLNIRYIDLIIRAIDFLPYQFTLQR